MSNRYEDFLKRLVEYRMQLDITQEKASQTLGITQSQLSKQELGKTIVQYKELLSLMELGWDMDYLLTGEKSIEKSSELTTAMKNIDASKYKAILEFVIWALTAGIESSVSDISDEIKCEICILKMKARGEHQGSILYEVRKITGNAQIAMSEKLGVNIKKYRMLEKAQINPDAELLIEIYATTGCKPSLFLTVDDVESLIIDDLWSRISEEKQAEIISIMTQVERFLIS